MPSIRILSDRVANQIAAGEVVERPAAVIKELLENSIDAGARKIEIEFRNGGKSYLRVEDDGTGMSHDQALLCLERHATSKIRKASDLNEVQTFGFRGEAIPSISSVSRFTMRTRCDGNAEGNEILINGGKMIHVKECGMPKGTRIEVAHLFNSVPGRRKFLKTEVTESSHIIHLCKLYALAHPNLTFSLLEGGRTILRSPACEDLLDRVREIFGKSLAEALTPIEVLGDKIKLSGLVGKPGFSRPTRKEMMFFVNRRPVDSKTVSYSLLEAYHTYAPKGRFPPAVLFIELDPSLIDVNVHPAKRELRFREEANVRTFLIKSILKFVKEFSGEKNIKESQIDLEKDLTSGQFVPKIDENVLKQLKVLPEGQSLVASSRNPEIVFSQDSVDKPLSSPKRPVDSLSDELDGNEQKQLVGLRNDLNASWHLIDNTHGSMALFRTSQGIVGFHCRAAYERIRYEQLEDSFEAKKKGESQKLLFAESLELNSFESVFLKKSLLKLKNVGFIIEEFGRNFYRLLECPTWIDPEHAKVFLLDLVEIGIDSGGETEIEKFAKEAISKQATESFGLKNSFSENDVVRIANQLLACRNPYTCPKGRPTYFELPVRDFENRFRRKI